jgi:hypothetical protein
LLGALEESNVQVPAFYFARGIGRFVGDVPDLVGRNEEVHAIDGVDFDEVAEDFDGRRVSHVGNSLAEKLELDSVVRLGFVADDAGDIVGGGVHR